MNKFLWMITISCSLFCQAAFADGIASLKNFYHSTNSMRAQFKQTVKDSSGDVIQEVQGSMQLARPNKFRWDYLKPYEQQIISDGQEVFLYDMDLEQVTIRTLNQTLGTSPAALLAGGEDVEKSFALSNLNRSGGLEWVQALPQGEESGYDRILLGFQGDSLLKMELYDSFKNVTIIDFSMVERNPTLDTASFLFKTPEGVDVVSE